MYNEKENNEVIYKYKEIFNKEFNIFNYLKELEKFLKKHLEIKGK